MGRQEGLHALCRQAGTQSPGPCSVNSLSDLTSQRRRFFILGEESEEAQKTGNVSAILAPLWKLENCMTVSPKALSTQGDQCLG